MRTHGAKVDTPTQTITRILQPKHERNDPNSPSTRVEFNSTHVIKNENAQHHRSSRPLPFNRQWYRPNGAGGQDGHDTADLRQCSFIFKAAKFRATEVQPRCTIFFEGEWKNANVYDYCVIMAENSDEDVQVTFYLTDAHEMNWVTETMDSAFFNRTETDKLFRLMNSNNDVRGQNVGRFRVDFHHWQPRHAEIFVFSFTPVRGRG
jgi:hypothetical protein